MSLFISEICELPSFSLPGNRFPDLVAMALHPSKEETHQFSFHQINRVLFSMPAAFIDRMQDFINCPAFDVIGYPLLVSYPDITFNKILNRLTLAGN